MTFKDFQKLDDKDNNSVVIDINNSASTTEKYFCSYCNTRLTPYTQEDMKGGYVCTKCTIEYWPKQQPVKKANRFEVPDGSDPNQSRVPPIAMIDDVNKSVSSTTYKQQKLPAAYEALRKQGFKFINYEER